MNYPCLENDSFDVLAHVGFTLLALTYLMKKELHLRICLAISSIVLALWGALALPKESCIATLSWNSLFCIINIGYAIYIFKKQQNELSDR